MKNKKWHFGGRLCAQCEYSMVQHTGCAKTKTNFMLRETFKKKEAETKKQKGHH